MLPRGVPRRWLIIGRPVKDIQETEQFSSRHPHLMYQARSSGLGPQIILMASEEAARMG